MLGGGFSRVLGQLEKLLLVSATISMAFPPRYDLTFAIDLLLPFCLTIISFLSYFTSNF